jgi:hypothetical protein
VDPECKGESPLSGVTRRLAGEIAETFHVSRKTIYRHLEPTTPATPQSSPA